MSEKVILITGATSGIGRVSAEKFASLGHTVLVHGRADDKIQNTINELKTNTGNEKVFGYKADLAVQSEVEKLIEHIKRDHTKLDVLINNAGLGPNHKKIMEVNYLATVALCFGLLPLLKESKGRIINIASEAQNSVDLDNLMNTTGMSAYAQSKLAVIEFSFLLAEKLKTDGVKVYALDPGSFLSTKMVKETWGSDGRDINIGADAHVRLALSEELEDVTGEFFTEGRPSKAHPDAYNRNLQNKLWELTQTLI